MELKPTKNRIIVVREIEKESEIIISPREKESLIARVLVIGPKVKILKPGDRIILRKTVGHEITFGIDGERQTFIICDDDQVDGVIK